MEVNLGEELFRFDSFSRWVDTAATLFRRHGLKHGYGYVCVDASARICQTGREFTRARDEGTFPIVVYSTNPAKRSAPDPISDAVPDVADDKNEQSAKVANKHD